MSESDGVSKGRGWVKIYFSRVATVPASEVELSDDQKKAYYYTHAHAMYKFTICFCVIIVFWCRS